MPDNMEVNAWMRYKNARYNFFKWRHELGYSYKIALAFLFACITGLLAQMRLYLPWSPVPITGQTFAVMLTAIILGKWGGVSQVMYAGIGIAGIPWFAGGNGGIAVVVGPTGGYIIGFIFASFFMGYFVDKHIRTRTFSGMLLLMLFANFAIIHSLGLLQLYSWLSLVKHTSIGLLELLMMGTIPFIAGDLTKIFAAAAIAKIVTPKRAYNGEVDIDKFKNWKLP